MMADHSKLIDNTALTVTARLSMVALPFMLGLLSTFAWNSFDAQATTIQKIEEKLPTLTERVAVLENKANQVRLDREVFQEQALAALKELQNGLADQSAQIASLTATIEAQQRQIDQRFK